MAPLFPFPSHCCSPSGSSSASGVIGENEGEGEWMMISGMISFGGGAQGFSRVVRTGLTRMLIVGGDCAAVRTTSGENGEGALMGVNCGR